MDFRYDNTARVFDEELGTLLAEKSAKKREGSELTHDADTRISTGQTAMDEIRAIIDASRHKSAAQEVAEHRVRNKLAALRGEPERAVNEFINAAKNG